MSNITKVFVGIVGVIVAVAIALSLIGKGPSLGADVMTNPQWFYNGSSFGKGNWFVGGNAGDESFGVSASQDGSNPVFSISSAGTFSASAMTVTTLTAGTFTQGGGIGTIATTSTSYTLSASEFDTENVLDITPGGASLTLTLPATSTLTSFIPTAGQVRSVYIRNATTTAGINITVAGGTGTVLRTASSTAIIQSDTAGAKGARLDFVRRTSGDISVFIVPFNN